MKIFQVVLSVTMFCLTTGCTHTVKMVPNKSLAFEEQGGWILPALSRTHSDVHLNEVLGSKEVHVMMLNGLKFRCTDVVVGYDSTSWFNISRQRQETVGTPDIYEMTVSNWEVGLWDGFDLGFWLGFAGGLGFVPEDDASIRTAGALVVGVGGFLAGGVTGAIVKGRYRFVFLDPATGK